MEKRKFQRKPDWIKVRQPGGEAFLRVNSEMRKHSLHTVCEEARCPNLAECWGGGTATLMIMGDMCTRGCRFCSVKSGWPANPPDPQEPKKAAESVVSMNLKYVVLTSVDRDDLADAGADHFAQTIEAIHDRCEEVLVEALVPDFQGKEDSILRLMAAKPEVYAHNVETVRRLTPQVRDRRSSYDLSLKVLKRVKELDPKQWTKSSIMLGLGETEEEVLETMQDLRKAKVDFLTLGQYLKPSSKHLDVVEFVHPDQFEVYREKALAMGFEYVASGPLVRSSYRAGEFYLESMIRAQGKMAESTQSLPIHH